MGQVRPDINVGQISTKTDVVAGTSQTFAYTYDVDGQLANSDRIDEGESCLWVW